MDETIADPADQSLASIVAPWRRTTTACTSSPQRVEGTPITAASPTISCWLITHPTSARQTFSPPDMIMSFSLSCRCR